MQYHPSPLQYSQYSDYGDEYSERDEVNIFSPLLQPDGEDSVEPGNTPPQDQEPAEYYPNENWLRHGITYFKRSPESDFPAHCTSVEPLPTKYVDFELDRVKSISFYHIAIIVCTIFFNIFQNSISLKYLGEERKIPIEIITILTVVCAFATLMQTMLARAFRIIEIPIRLSFAQEAFLSSIERQLEEIKLKENHIEFNDLLILISPEGYAELDPPKNTRLSKNDYEYSLQKLAHHYGVHLHILCVNTDSLSQINLQKLPLKPGYEILAYSPEYYSSPSVSLPAHSLLRYCGSAEYRQLIHNSPSESISLTISLLKFQPCFMFVIVLPFIATALQGISSLNDVLSLRLKEINGWPRLGVIAGGLVIGVNKGIMTYVTKVPPAKEKLHLCAKKTSDYMHALTETPKNNSTQLTPNSQDTSYLRTLYYFTAAVFWEIFGLLVAVGTTLFYAGLGLFFSKSGLVALIAFIENCNGQAPSEKSHYYNIEEVKALSFLFCISVGLLNGVLNQGLDAYIKFHGYAKECWTKLNKNVAPQQSNLGMLTQPSNTSSVFEVIRDVFTRNTPSQNMVLGITLIDSFAAAVTAYKGSTEILLACIKWSNFFEPMKNYFAPLIAGSIFVSQTYFSFKLYKEDEKSGGNLWAKVYREKVQDWLPDWLKERLPKTEIIFPADGSNASPNLFKRLTNPTAPEEHQRSRSPTPDYFI